jgi:hypothetical protein
MKWKEPRSISSLASFWLFALMLSFVMCKINNFIHSFSFQALNDFDKCNCTRSQLESCISWLQIALLSAAGFTSAGSYLLTADTVFGHAWKPNREECCCGLVSVNMVQDGSGRWIEVFNNDGKLLCQDITHSSALSSVPPIAKEQAVVDLFKSKHSAVKLSLESCVNLLGIGMIVYRSPNE